MLCVVMSSNGEQCYSGGIDGLIQGWNTTNPNIDPYDSYGELWVFIRRKQVECSEAQYELKGSGETVKSSCKMLWVALRSLCV